MNRKLKQLYILNFPIHVVHVFLFKWKGTDCLCTKQYSKLKMRPCNPGNGNFNGSFNEFFPVDEVWWPWVFPHSP